MDSDVSVLRHRITDLEEELENARAEVSIMLVAFILSTYERPEVCASLV